MKYRELAFTFALLLNSVIHAQSWCTPGATWRIWTSGFQSDVYSDRTCLGDTIIDGRQAYRIHNRSLGNNGPIQINTESTFNLVVDEDILWYRNAENMLDTLAWFSAQVGDHWKFGPTYGPGNIDTLRADVVATGARSFGSVDLRYVVLDFSGGFWKAGSDTIYERLGPLTSGWGDPILCHGSMEATCPQLICYHDDEIEWIAPNASNELCNTPLGVGALRSNKASISLLLEPNPSDGPLRVNITDPNWRTMSISVLDGHGRVVAQQAATGNNPQLDLGALPAGCYVVHVSDGAGERRTAKWLKR